MNLWHLTPDTPRLPRRVSPGEPVALEIGTWPIEPGQSVWVEYRLEHLDGTLREGRAEALWQHNQGENSYWRVELGPFGKGDRVVYRALGKSPAGWAESPKTTFRVGPKLYLSLMWHQHQPIYKDTSHPEPGGSYRQPWVRLHAIRDYYSMAALVAAHPGVHLTLNLTPALLWQLEDYLEHGATDLAQELTLKPVEALSPEEQERVLAGFFDADWHHQIYPHPRYRELFTQRSEGKPFNAQDLRDLQMWFNLSWFGLEFREGQVELVTGEVASAQRFVNKERGFSQEDLEAMLAEQYKIMRAVVPLHKKLQEQGQVEVSTTPFYHPILPLLVDTDQAAIDRPGASLPRRFAYPQDAEAQVRRAVEYYTHQFGRPPKGMWPAEGAVAQFVLRYFARQGIRWLATDQGVLMRSGRWGYDTRDPEVLCQPYRAEEGGEVLSLFFRDAALSDNIGFRYQGCKDFGPVAKAFVEEIKERFTRCLTSEEDRVLPVILDGENAWGAYCEDARPFLQVLYGLLEQDPGIETVTFAEYLEGNPARGIAPHPLETQAKVYDLFTGSWIDENGSTPGVDLGTWIGEEEENRAWELLLEARETLERAGATPESALAAFEAMYMAEGSDWFWWFGDDQDSGNDAEFDELFRTHLKNVYRGAGLNPPAVLEGHIVPQTVVWTFARPVGRVQPGDRLSIQTNCPGVLNWWWDGQEAKSAALSPVGGVMAGVRRYQLTLGPLEAGILFFRFHCTHAGCDGQGLCRQETLQGAQVIAPGGR